MTKRQVLFIASGRRPQFGAERMWVEEIKQTEGFGLGILLNEPLYRYRFGDNYVERGNLVLYVVESPIHTPTAVATREITNPDPGLAEWMASVMKRRGRFLRRIKINVCECCHIAFPLWMIGDTEWQRLPKRYWEAYLCEGCYQSILDGKRPKMGSRKVTLYDWIKAGRPIKK